MQLAADPDGKTVWLAGRLSRGEERDWHKQPFVRVKLSAGDGKEVARVKLQRGWGLAHALHPDGTLASNRFDIKPGTTEGDLTLRIVKPDGSEQSGRAGRAAGGL